MACPYNTSTTVLHVMITSYLAPFPSYGWLSVKLSLARGEYLTLTLSVGVIPCQYRHKWYIVKNYIFFGLHFCRRKYPCVFNHFSRNPPRKLRNSVKLGYYAVQGHSMSPILIPIESSYATFY